MSEKEAFSDKQVFKVTSFLGGLQVFSVILSILRSKVIAIFLGPAGMGLSSLYTTIAQMTGSVTSLGLSSSAVRDISQAVEQQDSDRLGIVVKVFRRWIWFSSILGALVMVLFSKQLSFLGFHDYTHVIALIALSSVVFFNAQNSGEMALLQGSRQFKLLAKGTLIGASSALLLTVPLYYFYGIKGIVPALILSAICTWGANFYFSRRYPVTKLKMSYKESYHKGKDMLKLGIVMMIGGCLTTLTTYLVYSYINYRGGLVDVGLFQAGIGLTTQCVGLLFTAMGTEYYPRLVSIHTDNVKVRNAVNQQSIIILLIATPILVLLISFLPLVIKILYTSEFLSAVNFTRCVALGMFFKVVSFALGYVSFAKGDKKLYFMLEGVIYNSVTLVLNVAFYYFWGLNGLGISFILSCLLYLIVLFLWTSKRYEFSYNSNFLRLAVIQLFFCLSIFLITIFLKYNTWTIIAEVIVCAGCLYFSYKELDKRVGLTEIIKNILNKRNK